MFNGRWSYLKQEWLPLVYLSFFQIWWNFESPVFNRLGTPWNAIVSIMITIMCLLIYMHIIANPTKYVAVFNLDYIDAPQWFKDALQISRIVTFNLVFLFVWYKDLYGMSNFHYIFCYAHCLLVFLLLARAVNKHRTM